MPEKRCGLGGCRGSVVPGAFIEGMMQLRSDSDELTRVRVEVCLTHFDTISPPVVPNGLNITGGP